MHPKYDVNKCSNNSNVHIHSFTFKQSCICVALTGTLCTQVNVLYGTRLYYLRSIVNFHVKIINSCGKHRVIFSTYVTYTSLLYSVFEPSLHYLYWVYMNKANWIELVIIVSHLAQPKKKSYYSNLTLHSLSAPIWNNIPEHMKSAITVNTFKSMLKKHVFYTY